MPCYRPLEAYQCLDGAVVFSDGKGNKRYDIQRQLLLACGQCVGCRLERSRQWAIRCTHEKQMHDESCFATLTYNEENLPANNSLEHRHVQLFIKRLRKALSRGTLDTQGDLDKKDAAPGCSYGGAAPIPPKKIRYYLCGEYGEKTQRAHYHVLIFGWTPKDQKFWSTSSSEIKSKIYTSATLEKIWGKGRTYIGEVTFESAAYVARYIMKKINGRQAKKHYESVNPETGEIINRKPEYTKMSLKPGIGATWLEKYKADAYPEGKVVARGHKSKTPKYYDKKYKKTNPLDYEDLLYERHKEMSKQTGENSKERLAVRETVAKAKIAFLKRTGH